jgi:hypothetical protein
MKNHFACLMGFMVLFVTAQSSSAQVMNVDMECNLNAGAGATAHSESIALNTSKEEEVASLLGLSFAFSAGPSVVALGGFQRKFVASKSKFFSVERAVFYTKFFVDRCVDSRIYMKLWGRGSLKRNRSFPTPLRLEDTVPKSTIYIYDKNECRGIVISGNVDFG